MVDIVERLAGIRWFILRQVIIRQNRTGMGHALQEIILKERSGVRQVALALNSMISIAIFAIRDLGLLVTKTINVLAQGPPGGVRAGWRIVLDDEFLVKDEAFTEDVGVHHPVHI